MSKTNIEKLKEVVAIASSPGNYNSHPYMYGMANGLELAIAIMEDRAPIYLDRPDKWLSDDDLVSYKIEMTDDGDVV